MTINRRPLAWVAAAAAAILPLTLTTTAHATNVSAPEAYANYVADKAACATQTPLARAEAALQQARKAERVVGHSTTSRESRARIKAAVHSYKSSPVVLVDLNMDWATGAPKDEQALAWMCSIGADFTTVQEAKNITLRSLLPSSWATNQVTASSATAGSAVSWTKVPPALAAGRRAIHAPRTGLHLGVSSAQTRHETMARYISFVDTRINGHRVRIIAVHYPPARVSFADPAMTRQIHRVIATRPNGSAWIVGGDFNQHVAAAAARIGGRVHGYGIDGFVTSRSVRVVSQQLLTYPHQIGETDHPGAVKIAVRVR